MKKKVNREIKLITKPNITSTYCGFNQVADHVQICNLGSELCHFLQVEGN